MTSVHLTIVQYNDPPSLSSSLPSFLPSSLPFSLPPSLTLSPLSLSPFLAPPPQRGKRDFSNFDTDFISEKAKLTPVERDVVEAINQTEFDNFTYTSTDFPA